MGSLNRVIIIGNLGAKPEFKYIPSGQAVCELRVATNEMWKDKADGQAREKTEWHRVVVWGKTAESCAEYLDKGRQVCVEGRLQTRSWEDKKTGDKRYATEIVASNVTFLGGKSGSSSSSRDEDDEPRREEKPATPVNEDDIPF